MTSTPNAHDPDAELMSATNFKDVKKAEAALAAGANVNARDARQSAGTRSRCSICSSTEPTFTPSTNKAGRPSTQRASSSKKKSSRFLSVGPRVRSAAAVLRPRGSGATVTA
jgi:hypothetical protein